MIIREETDTEIVNDHIMITALRRVVDHGDNICLNGYRYGVTLTYEEWNWLLDLAVIGLRHEVK